MDKDRIIQISSLEEYISSISLRDRTSFHSRTTNYRSIYRGQANGEWKIEPSVYRSNRFEKECEYIRELERLEPASFSSLTRIEKLIKMQHYGLPTRLLDFTYNSLVALYFACSSQPDKDGIVFEVNAFPLYNQEFVWISIVMKFLFEFGRLPFQSSDMIEELRVEKRQYPTRGVEMFYESDQILKILTTPHGIYPHFTNDRIKAQDGVFVLAGMKIKDHTTDGTIFEKQCYTDICDLWPESRSIVIPSEIKEDLLHGLEKIGIHQRRLFPELEAQASYVTKYIDNLL